VVRARSGIGSDAANETMKRHMTLNLDTELLQQAQEALGTSRTTETVHRALAEVVNRRRRQSLAMRDLPGLTPESLQRMRQNRTFDDADTHQAS